MKKVLILYASYGGGHFSAAKNIKEYIDSNYKDVEVILFDFMRYVNKAIDKITVNMYSFINKNIPWMWGEIYYHTQNPLFDKVFTLSNKIISYKIKNLFRKENPDIIISTHFFAGHICSLLKKKGKITAKLANIITDYGEDPYNEWIAGHQFIDYIFTSSFEMKNVLINKGVSSSKVFDTGIPISPKFLNKYNKTDILKDLDLIENKKTLLFFGGGEMGLGKSKTVKIFDELARNFKNIQIIAIAGKNKELKKVFEKISIENNREDSIKVFGFTNRVSEFMCVSDIVITKPGGLTTTECLVSNLPIIAINPIPGQETENAEFLKKNNCAYWLKKDDNIYEVLDSIINNDEKLKLMKESTFSIAKPNSCKDICRIIFE